jgi:hypothetical protein
VSAILADADADTAPLDRFLPLSLEQVSAARTKTLNTWQQTVQVPIPADPDATALARALATVVSRHQPLRLRYVDRPAETGRVRLGQWQRGQRFAPPAPHFPLEEVHYSSAQEADRSLTELEQTQLNLVDEGPLRARLCRMDGYAASLILVVHHLAWDGLSRVPFERELLAAYEAHRCGLEPALPPLPCRFSDHVIAQRHSGRQLTAEQTEYWSGLYTGWNPDEALGWPGHETSEPPPRYAHVHTALPVENIQQRLQRVARATRLRPGAIWLGAVLTSLWAQHDQEVISIAWVHHGRDGGDLMDLVGFFSRTVPMRIQLHPQQHFGAFCAEVGAQMKDGIRNSAAPWSILRHGELLLGPRGENPSDGQRPRLARVVVNIHGNESGAPGLAQDDSEPQTDVLSLLKRPLLVTPRPGQLWLDVFPSSKPSVYTEFDRQHFPDELSGAYVGGLGAVLSAVAESGPQVTLAELRAHASQGGPRAA